MPVDKRTIVMRAREMRKNMTPAEKKLWYGFLSGAPWKFRRQAKCGYYILDFYCIPLSLAIEVDGNQHYTPDGLQYDQARSDFLACNGISVLRFTNQQVLEHFDMVCEQIKKACNERPHQYRKKEIPMMPPAEGPAGESPTTASGPPPQQAGEAKDAERPGDC